MKKKMMILVMTLVTLFGSTVNAAEPARQDTAFGSSYIQAINESTYISIDYVGDYTLGLCINPDDIRVNVQIVDEQNNITSTIITNVPFTLINEFQTNVLEEGSNILMVEYMNLKFYDVIVMNKEGMITNTPSATCTSKKDTFSTVVNDAAKQTESYIKKDTGGVYYDDGNLKYVRQIGYSGQFMLGHDIDEGRLIIRETVYQYQPDGSLVQIYQGYNSEYEYSIVNSMKSNVFELGKNVLLLKVGNKYYGDEIFIEDSGMGYSKILK